MVVLSTMHTIRYVYIRHFMMKVCEIMKRQYDVLFLHFGDGLYCDVGVLALTM